jgi:HEAT repeat protein
MVRRFAAESVGKARVAALAEDTAALLDDTAPEVRRSAVNALSRLASVAHETVSATALKLIESDSPDKRLDGTRLLAALADNERLGLMAKDPDPSVRRTAISCLGNLRHPHSISFLSLSMTDEEPDVRVAAATALGQVGGPEALKTLLMSLEDLHSWVQVAALKSIGRLGYPDAVPAVTALFHSAEGVVLITAMETLVAISGSQAVPLLVAATSNSDIEVVKAALDHLQRYPDGWKREVGEQLLTHENREIRRRAASLVADHCGEHAYAILERAAVNETDEATRKYLLELADRVR